MTKNRQRLGLLSLHASKILDYCIDNKMTKPEASIKDIVFIMLITDIFELSNSVCSLFDSKSKVGIKSLIRISFEKFLFLEFIKQRSSHAMAYYCHLNLNQLEYFEQIEKGGKLLKSLSSMLNKSTEVVQTEVRQKFEKSFEPERRDKLKSEFVNLYDHEVKESEIFNKKWYDFDKKTPNIRALAEKIGELDNYFMFYKMFSDEVHSGTTSHQYVIGNLNGTPTFGVLRNVDESNNQLLAFMINILYDSMKILISEYNPPKYLVNELNSIIEKTIDLAHYYNRKK